MYTDDVLTTVTAGTMRHGVACRCDPNVAPGLDH